MSFQDQNDLRRMAREHMRVSNLSGARLAGRIGITRQAFNQWLNATDEKSMHPNNEKALLDQLKLTPEISGRSAPLVARGSGELRRTASRARWPQLPTAEDVIDLISEANRTGKSEMVQRILRVQDHVWSLSERIYVVGNAIVGPAFGVTFIVVWFVAFFAYLTGWKSGNENAAAKGWAPIVGVTIASVVAAIVVSSLIAVKVRDLSSMIP